MRHKLSIAFSASFGLLLPFGSRALWLARLKLQTLVAAELWRTVLNALLARTDCLGIVATRSAICVMLLFVYLKLKIHGQVCVHEVVRLLIKLSVINVLG